jgi:hypothetical protein
VPSGGGICGLTLAYIGAMALGSPSPWELGLLAAAVDILLSGDAFERDGNPPSLLENGPGGLA